MNRCSEYQELISRLIDQDLNEEEERALREHMAECEDCRAMYEFMTQMSDSVAESLEDLPEGLHENIMAQVRRQAIREKNQPRRILRVVLSTAAVAVLVVGVVFGTGVGRMGKSQAGMMADARMSAAAVPESAAAPAEFEAVPAEAPAEAEEAIEAPAAGSDTAFDVGVTGWPGEILPDELREFLGGYDGQAVEAEPGEPVQILNFDGQEFAFYEVDGALLYRDPADGQIYRSDRSAEQLREFIQGRFAP